MLQQEPVFDRIIQNGHNLLDATEPGTEKDALQKRLNDVTDRWRDVKQTSTKRKDDIERLYPLCKTYDDEYTTFSVWLVDAEKRKNGFHPVSSDKEILLDQLDQVKVRIYLYNFMFNLPSVGDLFLSSDASLVNHFSA